jgi:hypothetical protein
MHATEKLLIDGDSSVPAEPIGTGTQPTGNDCQLGNFQHEIHLLVGSHLFALKYVSVHFTV